MSDDAWCRLCGGDLKTDLDRDTGVCGDCTGVDG